jgi:hypothetical protein
VDWPHFDLLTVPGASAAALSPMELTPLDWLGNKIVDGLSLMSGNHNVHANAITISRAENNQQRCDAVEKLLRDANIAFTTQAFSHTDKFRQTLTGTNLIVDLAGTAPTREGRHLMITAHFDTEPGSEGFSSAVSCAVLVDLIQHFKENLPADALVQFLFLDASEQGFRGAKVAAKSLMTEDEKPDLVVNLDLTVGKDSEMLISGSNYAHNSWLRADEGDREAAKIPRSKSDAELRFVEILGNKAEAKGFNVEQKEEYPLQSDHVAFQFKGIPAVGISVLKPGESEKTSEYLKRESEAEIARLKYDDAKTEYRKLQRGSPQAIAFKAESMILKKQYEQALRALLAARRDNTLLQRMNHGDKESQYHSGTTQRVTEAVILALDDFIRR